MRASGSGDRRPRGLLHELRRGRSKTPLVPRGPATTAVGPSATGYSMPASCIAQWSASTVSLGTASSREAAQIDGVEREDDTELGVHPEVREGGAGERSDPGLVAPALCLPSPVRGHRGETGGHEHGGREDRDQRAEATDGAALERALPLRPSLDPRRASRSRSRALAARYSCSSRERASSVDASHARSSSRRRPRSSRLGSRPEPSQSAAATESRRCWRRSSWAPSIHMRRRSHERSSASWATSTVGPRVAGSRSKESRRWRPNVSITPLHRPAIDLDGEELGSWHEPPRVRRAFAGDARAGGRAASLPRVPARSSPRTAPPRVAPVRRRLRRSPDTPRASGRGRVGARRAR